jgi:3-dehydroquinate dehydratase II
MSTASLLVLNGPNLNLLGTREPEKYGTATLADVEALAAETAARFGWTVQCRQSNHEGQLIDWIHEARGRHAGIVLNPGAYSHTSIAIRDALSAVELPVVEVHLTNIHAREEFRHRSYVSGVAEAVLCGTGMQGYAYAVEHLARKAGAAEQR